MKFEHFEGTSPADQFDRLGKKEDLNFLSKNLTEELNDKIEEIKIRIADLKETLRTRGEEEEILAPGFLQDKALELKEAEAELKVLEAQGQDLDKKNLADNDLQAGFGQSAFKN